MSPEDVSKSFFLPSQQVYLDHNATTPPAAFLSEKIAEWFMAWGNPSSIHWAGRKPKALLRQARQNIAKLVGSEFLELVFTSGGSEANNLAIKGIFETSPRKHFITTEIEHPSVMQAFESLKEKGAKVSYLRIGRDGELDWDHYLSLLSEETALVSVMFANNETGAVLPIKKMVKEAHKVGALFHTDAVQGLGKVLLNVKHLDVDLATFSGHKFYSLKGVGALYVRKGISLARQIDGGGQERHRRAGTENTLAILSFGEVAKWADKIPEMSARLEGLRNTLQEKICSEISGVQVNGANAKRVPNTLSLSIDGVDGESLLMNLDIKGFAVSTGAACSSGSPEPSPVLRAMGLSLEEAQCSLRLSLGWGTDEKEIERFILALKEVVQRLRELKKEALIEY